MDFAKVMFSPDGRIGQQDFWIGVLVIIGSNFIAGIISPLSVIVWPLMIWCGIAVYGKRLHDAGKSAWLHVLPWALWLLLAIVGIVMIFGAGLGAILSSQGGDLELSQIIALLVGGGAGFLVLSLSSLVWIIYTLWVGFMAGTPEENAHGPVPGRELSPVPAASAGSAPDEG